MSDRKAVIKNADMSEDMQQDAGQLLNELASILMHIFFCSV